MLIWLTLPVVEGGCTWLQIWVILPPDSEDG